MTDFVVAGAVLIIVVLIITRAVKRGGKCSGCAGCSGCGSNSGQDLNK